MNHSLRKILSVLGFVVAATVAAACDTRPTSSTSAPPPACPKCECKCSCPTATGGTSSPTTPVATSGSQEEIEELTYGLSRKLAKRDPSCLADFERLGKLAPNTVRRMATTHGMCMMVAGKCEQGSAVVRKELLDSTELGPTMVDRSIETYQSMYCSGPLDDRGELLRALQLLVKGAYQENIGIRACTNASKTVARLKGRVRPKDDEDHQIKTVEDTFGSTAAACFARAGDCGSAWTIFNDEFAAKHFAQITDPKLRADTARQTFDSMVPKCKGRP